MGFETSFEKAKLKTIRSSTAKLKKDIRGFNAEFRAIARKELRRRGVSESKIPGSRLRIRKIRRTMGYNWRAFR